MFAAPTKPYNKNISTIQAFALLAATGSQAAVNALSPYQRDAILRDAGIYASNALRGAATNVAVNFRQFVRAAVTKALRNPQINSSEVMRSLHQVVVTAKQGVDLNALESLLTYAQQIEAGMNQHAGGRRHMQLVNYSMSNIANTDINHIVAGFFPELKLDPEFSIAMREFFQDVKLLGGMHNGEDSGERTVEIYGEGPGELAGGQTGEYAEVPGAADPPVATAGADLEEGIYTNTDGTRVSNLGRGREIRALSMHSIGSTAVVGSVSPGMEGIFPGSERTGLLSGRNQSLMGKLKRRFPRLQKRSTYTWAILAFVITWLIAVFAWIVSSQVGNLQNFQRRHGSIGSKTDSYWDIFSRNPSVMIQSFSSATGEATGLNPAAMTVHIILGLLFVIAIIGRLNVSGRSLAEEIPTFGFGAVSHFTPGGPEGALNMFAGVAPHHQPGADLEGNDASFINPSYQGGGAALAAADEAPLFQRGAVGLYDVPNGGQINPDDRARGDGDGGYMAVNPNPEGAS